jgi:hypothetical protein
MKDLILGNVKNDVVVGMDEVVSVFVSKYEDDLFDKKKVLSNEVKMVKKELENEIEVLKGRVNKKDYEIVIEKLGLESKVSNVDVSFNDKDRNGIIYINVDIKEKGKMDRYGGMSKNFEIDLSKKDCKKYYDLEDEVSLKSSELLEVNNLIKDISRKERKIRSKISEMKLKESGFEGLLDNKEMLKLIEVED